MYIKVKVTPNAKKESVLRKDDETFIVSVKEPAERNLANRKMLELLSEELKVPLSDVRIINGHHSPGKLISIKD